MHTVTKVLVVFAALLCVLLSALTMSYAINADRIVSDWNAQAQRRIQAETRLSEANSAAATERERLSTEIASLSNTLNAAGIDKRRLEGELAQLRAEVQQAETARDSILQKIDQLGATAETQAKLIESYRDEVTKLRENELGYRQREIELVDRINDLDSAREVLEQSVRALQEQLEEARMTIASAGQEGGAGAAGSETIISRIPIRGRVLRTVKDPASGDTLVQISVGSNDRVRENMKFTVARDEFIANIVVVKTDLQSSLARIALLQSGKEIRPDDSVWTSNQ